MLAKFIEKITELAQPKTYTVDGKTYSNETLFEVKPETDRPMCFNVHSLAAIVELVRTERGNGTVPLYVSVDDATSVAVYGTYNGDMSRNLFYEARCDVPGFRGGFRDIEEAIIQLRSLFVPDEGVTYVLDLLSRIGKNDSIQITDNGVTQTVEAAQGVSLKAMEKIKPRVKLRPFRTFLEVEQPESDFLLRVDKDKGVGLFEADGGVWKLEAKRNIAEYFKRELKDLIDSGDVVILA